MLRNDWESFIQQAACVAGLVTGSATKPTISAQSGDLIQDQACVSISRTSAGVYVISVTNFRSQDLARANILAFTTPTTASNFANVTSTSYTASTNTAVVTVTVTDQTNTAQDNGFSFMIITL